MKNTFFLLLTALFWGVAATGTLAQSHADSSPTRIAIIDSDLPANKLPPELYIRNYVETRITAWQEKGEFEKTSDWQARVNETTRAAKAAELQAEAEEKYKTLYAQTINWNQFTLSDYDADNETFLIKSSDFGQFALNVPIDVAPSFKQNWSRVTTKSPEFYLTADKVMLLSLSFYNPANSHTHTYNSTEAGRYQVADISYNFTPLDIEIGDGQTPVTQNTEVERRHTSVGRADVDVNIPENPTTQENTFVVIIANENYNKEANVDYALNDGSVFKQYCEKTLGIPEKNIHYEADATYGTIRSEINWITSVAEAYNGTARLIFYYAGHGMPNEAAGNEAYLLPTDAASSDFGSAISLSHLYERLNEHPTQNVTVFLDACFSGSVRENDMLAYARTVRIKPKENNLGNNMVVFSATMGAETAYPYHEKQHGMFTYFLLKKLQETKGDVTYEELSSYIIEEVRKESAVSNDRKQNPQVNAGTGLMDTWKTLKLR